MLHIFILYTRLYTSLFTIRGSDYKVKQTQADRILLYCTPLPVTDPFGKAEGK